MKIERVDEKTVKCFLSNEELEEYQIDYKDFELRSEKAKQVVHDIILQAEEQVGYKPPAYALLCVASTHIFLTAANKSASILHTRATGWTVKASSRLRIVCHISSSDIFERREHVRILALYRCHSKSIFLFIIFGFVKVTNNQDFILI